MARHDIRDNHGKFARTAGQKRSSARRPASKRSRSSTSSKRSSGPTTKSGAMGWLLRLAHRGARVHAVRRGQDPDRIVEAWQIGDERAPTPAAQPRSKPAPGRSVDPPPDPIPIPTSRPAAQPSPPRPKKRPSPQKKPAEARKPRFKMPTFEPVEIEDGGYDRVRRVEASSPERAYLWARRKADTQSRHVDPLGRRWDVAIAGIKRDQHGNYEVRMVHNPAANQGGAAGHQRLSDAYEVERYGKKWSEMTDLERLFHQTRETW